MKFFRYGFLAACLFAASWSQAASTAWQSNPQGQVRLVSPYKTAPYRGEAYWGLEFKTASQWHVYWKNPGDAGYPPRLSWTGSQGFEKPELLWPAPHQYHLPGDLIAIGYTGNVIYPVRVQVTGSPSQLHARAHVDYLTCEESCVPHKMDFSLDVPAAAQEQADPDIDSTFRDFLDQVPSRNRAHPEFPVQSALYRENGELFFEVRLPSTADQAEIFFENSPYLLYGRPLRATEPDGRILLRTPVSVTPGQKLPSKPDVRFTLTTLGSGAPYALDQAETYAIQIAPPPITVPNPMGAETPNKTSMALILLFGFLGGLILNVMPCVLPVLSIKLFGLLQHSGEERWIITRDALASAAGIIFSFLIGGGIAIAAKKAGQAVGWGVQFQQPVFVSILAILVTLFTLNLWGVFEIPLPAFVSQLGSVGPEDEGVVSFFLSGLFATVLATPCSAPFLGTAMGFALAQPTGGTLEIFLAAGVGMSVPYLMLAIFPQSLQWLPKPGVWMMHVRVLMGFLLAATVVWLGYVLSAQVDTIGFTYFCIGLLFLGLWTWLDSTLSTSMAHRYQWLVRAFALLTMVVMVRGIQVHRAASSVRSSTSRTSLDWKPFDQSQIQADLAAGKSVFVDITADWCFTCKVNERAVLDSKLIRKAFADQKTVLMRGDWTNRNAVISDFLASFHRYGIPFYVLYRPNRPPIVLSELLTRQKVLDALNR